jgi:hypothetical protein
MGFLMCHETFFFKKFARKIAILGQIYKSRHMGGGGRRKKECDIYFLNGPRLNVSSIKELKAKYFMKMCHENFILLNLDSILNIFFQRLKHNPKRD